LNVPANSHGQIFLEN
jgi:hypothetical protein